MSTLLKQIDEEIARLQRARAALAGVEAKASAPKKKRNLTPEGRARIITAVKRRWRKQKKAA